MLIKRRNISTEKVYLSLKSQLGLGFQLSQRQAPNQGQQSQSLLPICALHTHMDVPCAATGSERIAAMSHETQPPHQLTWHHISSHIFPASRLPQRNKEENQT